MRPVIGPATAVVCDPVVTEKPLPWGSVRVGRGPGKSPVCPDDQVHGDRVCGRGQVFLSRQPGAPPGALPWGGGDQATRVGGGHLSSQRPRSWIQLRGVPRVAACEINDRA